VATVPLLDPAEARDASVSVVGAVFPAHHTETRQVTVCCVNAKVRAPDDADVFRYHDSRFRVLLDVLTRRSLVAAPPSIVIELICVVP
jgi:hypothetical protein